MASSKEKTTKVRHQPQQVLLNSKWVIAVATPLHPVPHVSVRNITGERMPSRKIYRWWRVWLGKNTMPLQGTSFLPLSVTQKKWEGAPRLPPIESRGPTGREAWHGSWQHLLYVPLAEQALPSVQARSAFAPQRGKPGLGSFLQFSNTRKGPSLDSPAGVHNWMRDQWERLFTFGNCAMKLPITITKELIHKLQNILKV